MVAVVVEDLVEVVVPVLLVGVTAQSLVLVLMDKLAVVVEVVEELTLLQIGLVEDPVVLVSSLSHMLNHK